MHSSHEQFLWVVEFYNRQQISEFWRNCWKSSWPPANEMQGAWFKSCAGVAFPSIPEWAWFSPCQEAREKGKKSCNIDLKIPKKILFHCPPTFLSSNPKILKAFLKPFPTPTEGNCYMTPPPLCSKFLKQTLINALKSWTIFVSCWILQQTTDKRILKKLLKKFLATRKWNARRVV